MLEHVRNLLYCKPELYESVYPEPKGETACMCRRMFQQFLGRSPASVLDIGCGTGRDLAGLSPDCPVCVGVDALPEMIACARSRRPEIDLHVGDMRTVRMGRSFDAILCMGSAFMYALTNSDVDQTLDTFVAHAHAGTLLILDVNNAAACLPGGCFQQDTDSEVTIPEFTAQRRIRQIFDRRRQLLIRRRTWLIPGEPSIEDSCEYRLLFPAELEHLLQQKGFRTVGMFDNMDLRDSDLSEARLYVTSLFRA